MLRASFHFSSNHSWRAAEEFPTGRRQNIIWPRARSHLETHPVFFFFLFVERGCAWCRVTWVFTDTSRDCRVVTRQTRSAWLTRLASSLIWPPSWPTDTHLLAECHLIFCLFVFHKPETHLAWNFQQPCGAARHWPTKRLHLIHPHTRAVWRNSISKSQWHKNWGYLCQTLDTSDTSRLDLK